MRIKKKIFVFEEECIRNLKQILINKLRVINTKAKDKIILYQNILMNNFKKSIENIKN